MLEDKDSDLPLTSMLPLEIYRNPHLAEAMVSLNMIDTQGGGIKRMFQAQRRRFFPLPDYDLSQPERVMVTLRGRILDVRYTRLLMAQGELDLATIMLLDKVQKGQRIVAEDAKRLKAAKLVEGRYPNLLVAGSVAAVTGQKAQHIRDRGFDSQYLPRHDRGAGARTSARVPRGH